MAIPFSNTNYRIPRGFANLLEGLTREVLREQPKDIPQFAAKYFSDLVENREAMGFDPAEWGASLEDRFYNNHSFQHAEESIFTSLSEGISHNKEGVTVVDSSVEIPHPLDVPLAEEHKVKPQDVPSEEEYKAQPHDVPSEEEYKAQPQEVPLEEEYKEQPQVVPSEEECKAQPQEVPLEEEYKEQPQVVPSEEECKAQPQDVSLEEECKVQAQDVSLEEECKVQAQDVSLKEECKVQAQDAPSEEEHNLQTQDAPSEEEHNLQTQEAPSEEEHNVQAQEVPSEEEKPKMEQHDVPSKEEEHKTEQDNVPSGEEKPKMEQHDVPSKEEEHKTEQDNVTSGEEEHKIQAQDVLSSTQLSEEKEYKPTEVVTSEPHLGEVPDHRESPVILESTADPLQCDASFSTQLSEGDHKEHEGPRQDQAATVIQAALRGHLVRQEVKKLQKEEAGDKSNISEPLAPEETSATQDEEQETDRTDLDSAELPQLQLGSTAVLPDISDPGVSHEHPAHAERNITDVSVDTTAGEATTSVTAQEEHQNSVQEDGLQVDTTEEKKETVTNEVMTGDDRIQAAAKGDEITAEDPEPEAAEPPSSGKELDTELTSNPDQNMAEDTTDHVHQPTGEPEEDKKDQTAEQPIIEDTGDRAAKATVEETSEQVAEATGQSTVEDTNDQATEAAVVEETANSGDQPASDPIPDDKSSREENESCRKHQEEALDIALDDPGANAAATKIQAGFRGHMTRKKMKGSDKEGKHKDGKEGTSSAEGSIES